MICPKLKVALLMHVVEFLLTQTGILVLALEDTPGMIAEMALSNGMVIMRKRVTQGQAMYHCETKMQGRLAVLLELEDADTLIEAIKNISTPYTNGEDENLLEFGMSRSYWIGLTDVAREGEWVWINEGSVLEYEGKWLYGQPDHLSMDSKNRSEHCVTLWNPFYYQDYNTHTFNDENCLNRHYFICELKRKEKTRFGHRGKRLSLVF